MTDPRGFVGLRGEDQIVSIGDSGVDFGSCFFHDSADAVPVNSINHQHRKMMSYVTGQAVKAQP
jgi:hypothetical protein